MNILGLIPARGGSKSIPRKNIVEVSGKPLLAYTAQAAAASRKLTRTLLSTDEEEIARVGRAWGLEVSFLRPAELAQDETGMLPVILHALEFLERAEQWAADIVVLLQPTSPLRTAAHIDAAIEQLEKTGADTVVSVTEVPHQFHPLSVMRLEDGWLKPYTAGPVILRRQDKPKVFARNGPAILVMRRSVLMEKKSLYGEAVAPFFMAPEESVDVDTSYDLELAEYFLTKKRRDI